MSSRAQSPKTAYSRMGGRARSWAETGCDTRSVKGCLLNYLLKVFKTTRKIFLLINPSTHATNPRHRGVMVYTIHRVTFREREGSNIPLCGSITCELSGWQTSAKSVRFIIRWKLFCLRSALPQLTSSWRNALIINLSLSVPFRQTNYFLSHNIYLFRVKFMRKKFSKC